MLICFYGLGQVELSTKKKNIKKEEKKRNGACKKIITKKKGDVNILCSRDSIVEVHTCMLGCFIITLFFSNDVYVFAIEDHNAVVVADFFSEVLGHF